MEIYIGVWIFLFGLVFGSFLNCTAMRLVRGEDFVHGRSACRSCGHELAAVDLIPLVSWLATGGKCRYCKAAVSARYPLSEAGFALLLEGLYLKYGLSITFAGYAGFTGCLFVLALVDLESFTIPDGCLVAGLAIYCVMAPFTAKDGREVLFHAAAGIVTGAVMLALSLIMDRVLGKESMGGGDIKLFALVGLWLGFTQTLLFVIVSCVIGLVFALLWAIKMKSDGAFPFGPAIAAAAYVMLLWGDELAGWYMSKL